MNKSFFKSLFQPVANRHYSGKKISVSMYALGYTLPVAVCLYMLATDFSKLWLVILGCIALYAVVDYIVFDAAADKVSWRLFWGKFYASKEQRTQNYSSAEILMKQYEQNPTPANYEQMQNAIKRSK